MSNEKMRHIEVPEKDIIAPALTGSPVYHAVSEKKIEEFCKPCDVSGRCTHSSNDQARYAAREWCGWARVNNERGFMTKDGFVVPKKSSKKE